MPVLTGPAPAGAEASPLALALAAIPDYARFDAAATRCRAIMLARGTAARPPLRLDVSAMLLEGTEIPEDLGQQLVEDRRALEYKQTEEIAFRDALQHLRAERDHALLTGLDNGLRVLAGQLDQLLVEARALADVAHLTAEQAIDADRGEDWRRFGSLADRLRDIRVAQDQLTAGMGTRMTIGSGVRTVEVLAISGQVRRWWEHWQRTDQRARSMPAEFWTVPGDEPPWPHDEADQLNVVYADHMAPVPTRAGLAWAVTAGAQLWVPTTRELLAEHQEGVQVGRDAAYEALSQQPRNDIERLTERQHKRDLRRAATPARLGF